MTGVMKLITTGADPAYGKTWKAINWPRVYTDVERLQKRIAKATADRKWAKVRALQWLLTHSLCAKLLAVKVISRLKDIEAAVKDGVKVNMKYTVPITFNPSIIIDKTK